MKTNVSINLNDTERSTLANFIDDKTTKRLATRAEIVALARLSIERVLIAQGAPAITDGRSNKDGLCGILSIAENAKIVAPSGPGDNLVENALAGLKKMAEIPDPEDTEHLADKSTGHVRGWNSVKYHPAGERRDRTMQYLNVPPDRRKV